MRHWFPSIPEPLLNGYAGIVLLLIIGSIISFILPAHNPDKWGDLRPRMKSWWVMCGLVIGALILGWQAFTLLFMLISYLALKEYMTLAPTRRSDRGVVLFAYIMILLSYGLVWINNYMIYLVFVPVYVFFAMAVMLSLIHIPSPRDS